MCDILLIEDEEGVAKVYAALLRGEAHKIGWPCSITICPSIEGAEKRVEQHKYDAVLLDLKLADSTAEQTAAEVDRLSEIWPPIVVLTFNAQETLRRQCLLTGAEDFITKSLMQAYPDIVLERIYNATVRHERQKQAA